MSETWRGATTGWHALMCLLALVFTLLAATAQAADLTIGTGGAFTSFDPHYQAMTTNMALSSHVFDSLVIADGNLKPTPGLAASWRPLDATTWEFKLRPGVKFHDGAPFTAADVAFSFQRVPTLIAAPQNFAFYVRPVSRIEVVDDSTIRLHTATATPMLPIMLSAVAIVDHRTEGMTTADYNSGRAANGTGPYRFVSFTMGDRAVFERNPAWWGEQQPWQRVTFRMIPNDAARVTALQAGDVDVIDAVPTRDVAQLRGNPELTITSSASQRLIVLYLDLGRGTTPFATDLQGKPLAVNPLQDARVRHALSLSIDRKAIAEHVMDGFAVPTGQLMPQGAVGYDPTLPPDPYDPDHARALLAQAGWEHGFGLTLQGPNDRYVNDAAIIQAVAQMWTRVGVHTAVDPQPSAMFFTRYARDEYSVYLTGALSPTGEADILLSTMLATPDPARGRGATIRKSHYANPALDKLLDEAVVTMDVAAREDLYRRATRIAMQDQALIPLHHQVNIWATSKGFSVLPTMVDATSAMLIKPTPQ